MSELLILCIDDERAVLDAIIRDLEEFAHTFRVEPAENADDARSAVQQALDNGDHVALVLADHLMPGTSGVDFLIELNNDPRTVATRKVLVTAQAGLADTIKAVNDADLHHYIAKPWKREELHFVVRRQLTDYVIENVTDVLPFMSILDGPRLMETIRTRGPRKPE
jgi:two-component system, OmpR family, phosphate regulon response regulator PhoB